MNTQQIDAADINVLVACEESQAETMAFRSLGFNAFSCDIEPARKGTPVEFHIQGDVTPYLNGGVHFKTQDGKEHHVTRWHLIIAHPPCTYISKVGSVWLYKNGTIDVDRLQKQKSAVDFFYKCLNAKADFVAVENPIPMKRAGLPKPSCYACPSWFGVKYTKKTLYWTRSLPPLFAQIDYPNAKSFVGASRGKYRSRTFHQLAQAIANQWGNFILNEYRSGKKAVQ